MRIFRSLHLNSTSPVLFLYISSYSCVKFLELLPCFEAHVQYSTHIYPHYIIILKTNNKYFETLIFLSPFFFSSYYIYLYLPVYIYMDFKMCSLNVTLNDNTQKELPFAKFYATHLKVMSSVHKLEG